MMVMDGAKRRSIIRRVWPQLVDFLSHHSEWLLKKAEMLLSQDDLSFVGRVPDLERKRLLILDMVLRDVDANPEVFRKFIQSVCFECSLPMELEIILMSVSQEGGVSEGQDDQKGCFPSSSRKLERRRPFSNFSSNNGKESKQKRLDAAERYCQHILSLMFRKFGIDRSAETAETKDEPLAFSQKFVNLVIHHSRASKLKVGSKKIKEEPVSPHEFKDHGNPMENLSELFKSVQMGITQVVLLLGKAGMGKTCFVHQICQQWAEGALPQFKLIFFFEFKQLNLIAKRKLTLQELLFEYFLQPDQPDTVFQFLLENAQQTLVILDGLDEFVENLPLPPIPFTSSSDLLMPCSVSELVANLCHGELLAGCTVLITSRLNLLPAELVKGTVALAEVWGFHRDNVEEYVSYFFQEPFQKEQALTLLNDNGKLLSMCYIPAMCHIICTCLKHLFLEDAENVQLPQTRTQFYTTMLQIFICKHQGGRTLNEIDMGQYQTTLTDLCELAFRGLEENKRVFDAGEVPEHVKDFFCHFGLLLASEVKMGKDPVQMAYTFTHFSFQEFFAALFLLASPTVDCKILKENFSLRSKWILKKETRMSFTENYHIFLSGLSSQGCRPFLCCLAGRNEVWIQERQNIITEILQKLAVANLTGPRIVELCHCVYETQDISLAQHIAKELAFKYQFRNVGLMPFDMVTLAFLINGSPHGVCLDFVGCPLELDYLDIWGSCENIKSLSFKNRQYGSEFAGALSKTMPKIKHLTTFKLTGGNLRSPGFEDLIRVFPNCHQLEEINLQDNKLKEQDMIKLAEIFPTVEKLKRMDLSHNKMSVGTVLAFSRAVAKCPKVSSLEIRKNILIISLANFSPKEPRLKDVGINEEEIAPKPRSLILQLQDCQLDSRAAEELVDILQNCSRLSKINLSDNQLGDEGCGKLMTVVSQMCTSGPLTLSNNRLSLKSIFCLLDTANLCPNVVMLEASVDQQIAVLTFANKGSPDALQSRNYHFHDAQLNKCQQMEMASKKICLTGNHFHGEDLKNLCLALRRCSSIFKLDLSSNSLGDSGILKIMDSIRDLKNLNSLILDNNQMSLDGVFSLLEVFSILQHINSVQLGLGSIQKCHLSFGEQIRYSPASKHARKQLSSRCLYLEGCTIGLDMTRLFRILTKCSGLAEINFSGNSLGDQELKQMLLCLPSLSSLRLLSVRDNAFSTNGICLLANSCNWCSRLSEVNLRSRKNAFLRFVESQASHALFCRFVNCDIDWADLRALGAVFENCDHLAELDLSGNSLDNEALRCLFGHLPKTQNSCLLKINRNRISQDGILLLVNFLATMDDVVEVHASLCPEKMLLITFRKQAKPQKILNLKECDFQAEHLAQLLSRLEECPALSDFTSINNGLTLSSAKTLLRALKRAAGVQKISIEEPWVADESFLALLSLAAEVQGEVITIMKAGSFFTLEQEFSPQVGKGQFVVDRTSHLLFPDAEGPTSFDALVHFPALQKLWLTNGRILPTSIEHVAEILQRGLFIEEINFSNSDLSSDGLSVLLDALAGKLKSINLGSLNLDNTTILKLSSKLSTMPFLRRLGLSNNHLDSPVCSRLAEGLKTIPQIEEIDLSCNKIQDAGMKEIAMVLPGMKNVKLINFSCNSITSAGGQWIAEGLLESERLEILKLSGNRIGNKTLEKLAPILPFKKHLKVLHLSSCQLDSEGLGHLVGILAKCPQIEEISLSENNIGDKGVMSFMTPWPPSSQLRKIELKVCGISDGASQTLIVGLSCCPFLEEIVLSWNKLGDETAKELAMVLPGMIRLKILDLDNNCITTYGASMLARQLPRCPGIQTIRLWHNPILKDVKQKLADQEPRLHFA
ncbi:protein NLRC5 isoform X2 [Crotalus tigris]|uniref:protein NLRC5 isoform X2 n=1 Tax=Crotalus tigris TaxID=88082 RepID=UPI00192F9654|nr:protein NLRC5 isoform X2 [Crotalus tigris]